MAARTRKSPNPAAERECDTCGHCLRNMNPYFFTPVNGSEWNDEAVGRVINRKENS